MGDRNVSIIPKDFLENVTVIIFGKDWLSRVLHVIEIDKLMLRRIQWIDTSEQAHIDFSKGATNF